MLVHTISFSEQNADLRKFRSALGSFATGVTVITTLAADGRRIGLTANSFSAVSLEPPLVLWSLKHGSTSLETFRASGFFAVNVLAAEQAAVSHRFASAIADRFDALVTQPGLGGCPLLPDVLATFECSTQSMVPGGDHVIFIGRVHKAAYREGEPLIFSAGRYCSATPLPEPEAQEDADTVWGGLS